MEIFIRNRGQRLTPTFVEQVQRRLELTLRRFQSRIGDVSVRLSDASGRRGGWHKRCRISVGLNGLGGTAIPQADLLAFQDDPALLLPVLLGLEQQPTATSRLDGGPKKSFRELASLESYQWSAGLRAAPSNRHPANCSRAGGRVLRSPHHKSTRLGWLGCSIWSWRTFKTHLLPQ